MEMTLFEKAWGTVRGLAERHVLDKTDDTGKEAAPVNASQRIAEGAQGANIHDVAKVVHGLHNMLKYDQYDPETGLFFNDTSVSFCFEVIPQTGADEQMTMKLTQLFTPIPPGYGVQWTMMGSSIFDDKLQAYMDMRHVAVDNARTSPFFVELARQRVAYVRKSKGRPLFPNTNYMVKASKLMFSVTKTGSHKDKRLVQDMWELRESLRSQLRTSNLPAFHGDPTSLIRFIRPMLDPELFFSEEVAPEINYDDGRSIKDQVTPFGQHVRVKHNEILFGKPPEKEEDQDTRVAMRSFGVQHYPQKKELWEMANIIGSFFDDGLQYPCPFVICGGVYTLDPAELDAKIPLKAARAMQNMDLRG